MTTREETEYGLTPAQYHAGLDKLWKALGFTGVQDSDVFTLAADVIRSLKEDNRGANVIIGNRDREIRSLKDDVFERAKQKSEFFIEIEGLKETIHGYDNQFSRIATETGKDARDSGTDFADATIREFKRLKQIIEDSYMR